MSSKHHPPPPPPPPRSSPSTLSLPFASLPDAKRVWLGHPHSREESLGRLCLLTPSVVAEAARSEIRSGARVGLNWDMMKLEYSQFGRQQCRHEILPLWGPGGSGWGACFDDAYAMNPQQSSQWDGFRHYSQPRNPEDPPSSQDRVFYGGTTKEEIMDASNYRIGTQTWAEEGIAGRGILLDYVSHAAANNITYSCFSTHSIPLKVLVAMCTAHKVTPRRGDILFIRTGCITEWNKFSEQQKQDYAAQKEPKHAGVEASLETLEWLWNSGFAAVAGDAISWEVYPTPGEVSMHEYLLAGWGCPIGELFDLEGLSQKCKQLGRYSFFVTSMPLNMPGGVSSPPNAMAIF